MKSFYKIEDGILHIGSGFIIPDSFIEYEIGKEPNELIEAQNKEIAQQELQVKINEAKLFLDKTDKKVLPYYEFENGDNSLEWYIEERSKARKFIRDNQ